MFTEMTISCSEITNGSLRQLQGTNFSERFVAVIHRDLWICFVIHTNNSIQLYGMQPRSVRRSLYTNSDMVICMFCVYFQQQQDNFAKYWMRILGSWLRGLSALSIFETVPGARMSRLSSGSSPASSVTTCGGERFRSGNWCLAAESARSSLTHSRGIKNTAGRCIYVLAKRSSMVLVRWAKRYACAFDATSTTACLTMSCLR